MEYITKNDGVLEYKKMVQLLLIMCDFPLL